MTEHDQRMDVGRKSKESILWSLTVAPLLQIFQFAISIVIARLLEPKDFGIMGIASVIIFYSNNISEFGFGDAIVRIKKITNQHIDTFFVINITISLFLFTVVLLTADLVAYFFETPELAQVLRVLSVIFIITSFYSIPQALLRRNLSYKTISKIDIIKRIGGMSFTLTFAILDFGYWALVYGTLAANLTAAIVIFFKAKWAPKFKFSLTAFKDIIGFASWSFISVQSNILGVYLDKLIVGKILGPVTLGYYEKSFGISFMPVQHIAQRISFVMFSTFSKVQGESDQVRHYFRKTITLTAFFCFPVLLGLYAIADHFVIVLLGTKWQPMIPSFKILLIAFVLSSLTAPFDTLNLSCGNYKNQVKTRILALFGLCFLLLFFARYGINYVAYVIVVYNFLLLGLSYAISREVCPLSVFDLFKSIMPAVIGTMSMFILLAFCTVGICSDLSLTNLIILVGFGVIFYPAFMFFVDFKSLAFLKKEILLRLGSITRKFD